MLMYMQHSIEDMLIRLASYLKQGPEKCFYF